MYIFIKFRILKILLYDIVLVFVVLAVVEVIKFGLVVVAVVEVIKFVLVVVAVVEVIKFVLVVVVEVIAINSYKMN